jgi:hypothetical protein
MHFKSASMCIGWNCQWRPSQRRRDGDAKNHKVSGTHCYASHKLQFDAEAKAHELTVFWCEFCGLF